MGRHQRNIMHQDIIDISMFASDPDALMLAMVCVSIAGAAWVLGMSAAGLPISAHQATLGGFLGVAAVMTPGAFSLAVGDCRGSSVSVQAVRFSLRCVRN